MVCGTPLHSCMHFTIMPATATASGSGCATLAAAAHCRARNIHRFKLVITRHVLALLHNTLTIPTSCESIEREGIFLNIYTFSLSLSPSLYLYSCCCSSLLTTYLLLLLLLFQYAVQTTLADRCRNFIG